MAESVPSLQEKLHKMLVKMWNTEHKDYPHSSLAKLLALNRDPKAIGYPVKPNGNGLHRKRMTLITTLRINISFLGAPNFPLLRDLQTLPIERRKIS